MSYNIGKFGKNKQKQDTSYGIFGETEGFIKQKLPLQGLESTNSEPENKKKVNSSKPTGNNFSKTSGKKRFFVFDIETVPCVETARNLLNLGEEISDEAVVKQLTEYHSQITGGVNEFHRQPFHKIVCVSFITGSIHQYANSSKEKYTIETIRSGGRNGETEEEILRKVFSYLETLSKQSLRLISFNGRGFDMPVLQYRAMKYGIDARWIFNDGLYNYNHRYSVEKHCDLLEMFSNFGASARVKMSEVCALLNVPCKNNGVDGSQVYSLFKDGKIEEIANYCEEDVISTFILYLRFMHHSGKLSADGYNIVVDNLIKLLTKEDALQSHKLFVEQFLAMNNNDFYIKTNKQEGAEEPANDNNASNEVSSEETSNEEVSNDETPEDDVNNEEPSTEDETKKEEKN